MAGIDYLNLDGDNGNFQDQMLREAPERYTYLDGLETVIEQNFMSYGAYRPHRYLPALYVTKDIQEGYVIHHGQIVSSLNMTTPDGKFNTSAGFIDTTGNYYHGEGFTGALKSDADSIYGYDRTLDGLIVPSNSTNANISDLVSAGDVEVKRMLADGTVAKTADINSKTALTRASGMKPLGVVAQIIRETQGANLSYTIDAHAYSVVQVGVLHVPYVRADAGRINAASLSDAGYAAVYRRHQFVTVTGDALMYHNSPIRVDGWGHLIMTTDDTTYPEVFGELHSFTHRTYTDLMTKVDAIPGLQSQGTTTTGGLTRRLYEFVKSIREARGDSTQIADIQSDVNEGYYGMMKIRFDLFAKR